MFIIKKSVKLWSCLLFCFVSCCSSPIFGAAKPPYGDMGNGHYRNPVLVSTGGDVTVVRVGKDYYSTYGKTLELWHSRDLVNWERIGKASTHGLGSAWAPDLIYHDGLFYIYVTPVDRSRRPGRQFMNVVMTAKNPPGPWSEPINLRLYGKIDPGHLVDIEGNRYLYVEKGMVAHLAKDGLSIKGKPEKVYEGCKYPEDWDVECFCLEAPKLLFREGYYYMLSAQGGTSGPPTAHMVVAARSEAPLGPWENSPHNPMIRTASREEKFWRQGHGQLIDDIEGKWWMLYTGYNKEIGYGKLVLLLPMEWTKDGWPVVAGGVEVTDLIAKPAGEKVRHDGILVETME